MSAWILALNWTLKIPICTIGRVSSRILIKRGQTQWLSNWGGEDYIIVFLHRNLLERELYSTIMVTTQNRGLGVLPQEIFETYDLWNHFWWLLRPHLQVYLSRILPSHHLKLNVLWSLFCANRNLLVFVHNVHVHICAYAGCMYVATCIFWKRADNT